MDYKIDQSVVIKSGSKDPDDPTLDLGGWQGRIIEIRDSESDDVILRIALDSITLRGLSFEYLQESEQEGLLWKEYFIGAKEVNPAKPRDSKKDVQKAVEEIENRVRWFFLGEQGERISLALGASIGGREDEQIIAWSHYLSQKLTFPFKAIVDEYQEEGSPLRSGDKLNVLGMELEDDHYGLIVKCTKGVLRYDVPLCDLAAVDKNSPNAQLIDDFRVWFSNR